MISHNATKRLSTTDAAALIGCSVPTLKRWRKGRYGPKWYKVGRKVEYHRDDVVRWLDAQRHRRDAEAKDTQREGE